MGPMQRERAYQSSRSNRREGASATAEGSTTGDHRSPLRSVATARWNPLLRPNQEMKQRKPSNCIQVELIREAEVLNARRVPSTRDAKRESAEYQQTQTKTMAAFIFVRKNSDMRG